MLWKTHFICNYRYVNNAKRFTFSDPPPVLTLSTSASDKENTYVTNARDPWVGVGEPETCQQEDLLQIKVLKRPWHGEEKSWPGGSGSLTSAQNRELTGKWKINSNNSVYQCIEAEWCRISSRCWIHKGHNIPYPNGQAMGCLLWMFVIKVTIL